VGACSGARDEARRMVWGQVRCDRGTFYRGQREAEAAGKGRRRR
jgi:hypothetical protein